jgi:hypothetical protein
MCWLFVCFVNLINAGSVVNVINIQSNVIILHQHVSVTTVTEIRWLMIKIQAIHNNNCTKIYVKSHYWHKLFTNQV